MLTPRNLANTLNLPSATHLPFLSSDEETCFFPPFASISSNSLIATPIDEDEEDDEDDPEEDEDHLLEEEEEEEDLDGEEDDEKDRIIDDNDDEGDDEEEDEADESLSVTNALEGGGLKDETYNGLNVPMELELDDESETSGTKNLENIKFRRFE